MGSFSFVEACVETCLVFLFLLLVLYSTRLDSNIELYFYLTSSKYCINSKYLNIIEFENLVVKHNFLSEEKLLTKSERSLIFSSLKKSCFLLFLPHFKSLVFLKSMLLPNFAFKIFQKTSDPHTLKNKLRVKKNSNKNNISMMFK